MARLLPLLLLPLLLLPLLLLLLPLLLSLLLPVRPPRYLALLEGQAIYSSTPH